MKFLWKKETPDSGQVVAFNVFPETIEDGYVLDDCSRSELKYRYEPELYEVIGGVLTPKSEGTKDLKEKKEALVQVIQGINKKNSCENKKKTCAFTVSGVSYNFVVDWESLTTIHAKCMTLMVRGGSEDTPVPAPGGKWKTGDTLDDGVTPVKVAMTVGEFLDMVDVMANRGINNFGVKELHKDAVKALFLDSNKTAQDILSYDYTGGWF